MNRALIAMLLTACTGGGDPVDKPPVAVDPELPDTDAPPADLRPAPAWVGMRRLAVAELRRSLDDLVGVDVSADLSFPEEDVAWSFDHLADSSPTSDLLIERLEAAAVVASEAWLDRVRGEVVAEQAAWTLGDPWGCAQQDVWDDERFWWISWVDQPVSWIVEVPADGDWLLSVDLQHRIALQGNDGLDLAIEVDGQERHRTRVLGPTEPTVLEVPLTLGAGTHELALRLADGMTLARDAAYTGDTSFCVTAEALSYGDLRLIGPRDTSLDGLPCHELIDPACREQVMRHQATRVWRRPPTEQELDRLSALVDAVRAEGGPFDEGLAVALRAMLLSPNFLYRPEFTSGPADRAQPLDSHALATRLSYTLWGTTPDQVLLDCAADGSLIAASEGACSLRAQLDRMLDDPRAAAFLERFVGQWLGIHDLPTRTSPDGVHLPTLGPDMVEETYAVFQEFLDDDALAATGFVAAPFTWLTQPLANHYGIGFGASGRAFRLTWSDGPRLGLLGQASVLIATSTAERTAPMRRGAWVLDRLLCDPVGSPPPGIPELGPDAEDDLAGAIEAHAANPGCAACHDRLDPIGLTLEQFDASGRVRPDHEGQPRTLPDGTEVADAVALTRWIAASEQHRDCVVTTLATYALGRHVARAEADRLGDWQATAGGAEASWRDLLEAIVTSPSFTHRVAGPGILAPDVEVAP
jgi:hypothetical protein